MREVRAKVVVDASGQNGLISEPPAAARLGSDAEQRRDLDLLGRAPIATPAATKAPRWCCRRRTRTAGSGTSRSTTTSSASASSAPFDYLFKNRGAATSRPTARKSTRCPAVQGAHRRRRARRRLLRDEGLLVSRDAGGRRRLGAGRRRVGVSRSALFVGRAAGAAVRARWRPTRSSRGWPRATRRRRSSASGGRSSTRASIACGGWCANTTTASASAISSSTIPDLRGTVTDLLIGDLFTDRVDKVWQPMESLYPPDKTPIPAWDAGHAAGGGAREGERAEAAGRVEAVG